MEYIEIQCNLQGKQAFADDIITAQLAEIGFESFTCDARDYRAYIQTNEYCEELFLQTMEHIQSFLGEFDYKIEHIEPKNWNAQWEADFQPVLIDDKLVIRAPFHAKEQFDAIPYHIDIEPKMSFGTGHHETTYTMIQTMLELDFQNTTVVDCGCGTGVLGIAASLFGAQSVFAFDYDSLCVDNTTENIERNVITNMNVALGGLDILHNTQYDIVLANINRNILTHNMHYLAQSVKPCGKILFSGFYEQDMPIVEKYALENQLKFVSFKAKNKWCTMLFEK